MENLSATLREMARRANDRIRVYNFNKEDFKVMWDSFIWTVPGKDTDSGQGKGQAILPRYVAENYVKHFTDFELGKIRDQAIKGENQRLIEKGNRPMAIDSSERLQFETQYSLDNVERRREVIKQIWLGIEEEYGMEQTEAMQPKVPDQKTIDQRLLDELDRPAKPLPTNPSETLEEEIIPSVEELAIKKEKLAKEVSK